MFSKNGASVTKFFNKIVRSDLWNIYEFTFKFSNLITKKKVLMNFPQQVVYRSKSWSLINYGNIKWLALKENKRTQTKAVLKLSRYHSFSSKIIGLLQLIT